MIKYNDIIALSENQLKVLEECANKLLGVGICMNGCSLDVKVGNLTPMTLNFQVMPEYKKTYKEVIAEREKRDIMYITHTHFCRICKYFDKTSRRYKCCFSKKWEHIVHNPDFETCNQFVERGE